MLNCEWMVFPYISVVFSCERSSFFYLLFHFHSVISPVDRMRYKLIGMMVIIARLQTSLANAKWTRDVCVRDGNFLCRYWWVSVGLVYKVMISFPCYMLTFVSKNIIDFVDYSGVNFILGWNWIISLTKCLRCSSPCGHNTKDIIDIIPPNWWT